MDEIKVSVIVPVYGVESYLSRCLDSLVGQTLKDIEIIIVNDCSPDRSQTIVQRYAERDSRIISVCNEMNIGQGLSRMKGLQLARGKYVAFVDADDYVELEMYEALYTQAVGNDYDVVGSNFNYVFPGGVVRCNGVDPDDLGKIDDDYILHKLFEFESSNFIPSSMCDKIYRLSFLKKNNISIVSEREYFLEDLIFNIEFFVNRPKVGWIPRSYYNYVIRRGSTMYSYRRNFLSRYLSMYDRIKTVLLQHHKDCELFVRNLDLNLFRTTFAFVSNNFSAPDGICVKIRNLFTILKHKRLKENVKRHSVRDISFHSTGIATKWCKYIIFVLMKYL